MNHPRLTIKRIVGLRLIAERIRPLVSGRAGGGRLFTLPRKEAEYVRAALKYVDALGRPERNAAPRIGGHGVTGNADSLQTRDPA